MLYSESEVVDDNCCKWPMSRKR